MLDLNLPLPADGDFLGEFNWCHHGDCALANMGLSDDEKRILMCAYSEMLNKEFRMISDERMQELHNTCSIILNAHLKDNESMVADLQNGREPKEMVYVMLDHLLIVYGALRAMQAGMPEEALYIILTRSR